MVAFRDLLEAGYFPRELPPIFTTASYAQAVSTSAPPFQGARSASELLPFSLGRTAGLRRQLAIPNPLGFANLSHAISANWPSIAAHLAHNKLSATSPSPGRAAGRALDPRFRLEALPVRRAVTRAGAKYLLQADIARFYSSVYTHTIPWAVHGKAVAKQQRRNRALYGNVLDECVRKCQDDQTVGLPIGPDTSLVIAELILAKVDANLRGLANASNAFRYIDDYEISCRTYRQAEDSLAALDDAVRTYQLDLNHSKSRIVELPAPLYDVWKDALAKFSFGGATPGEDRTEIVRYFSTAFDLHHAHPGAHVLNYALSRLPLTSHRASNWRLVESLLLQCLRLETGSTRYVIAGLLQANTLGRRLNRDRIGAALSSQVEEHARLGHSAEVAWAIWGASELRIPLAEEAAREVSLLDDAVVALLALRAKRVGVFPRGLRTRLWRTHMSGDGLYSPMWLLAYEAHVRSWLPDITPRFVDNDPFFGLLKRSNVSFLDLTPVSQLARIRLGVRSAADAFYP